MARKWVGLCGVLCVSVVTLVALTNRGGPSVQQRLAALQPVVEERWSALTTIEPHDALLIVVLKREESVELWRRAGGGPQLLRRWPMTGTSGGPGPKRAQGDGQIPEGLYRVELLNPQSRYHLSIRLSYPNQDDRRRAAAAGIADPGSDIYIHGGSATVGCVPIGDEGIEELFCALARLEDVTSVEVIMAPREVTRVQPGVADGPQRELYGGIAAALAMVYGADPIDR